VVRDYRTIDNILNNIIKKYNSKTFKKLFNLKLLLKNKSKSTKYLLFKRRILLMDALFSNKSTIILNLVEK